MLNENACLGSASRAVGITQSKWIEAGADRTATHPPTLLQAATQQALTGGGVASDLPFDADRGKATRAGR